MRADAGPVGHRPSVRQGFPVMGTLAHVTVVDGPDDAVDRAIAEANRLEAAWSRFRPDSDISLLNRAEGRPVVVGDDTFDLVERAVDAWRATVGWFDPTVFQALVHFGYTRTFELLDGAGAQDSDAPPPAWVPAVPSPGCALIELDPEARTVRLPAGVGLDPGGIGKGMAADRIAELIMADGAAGVLVDLGGDLRVRGGGPDGRAWAIDVIDPFDDTDEQPLVTVHLTDGAVATSSVRRRRWTHPAGGGTTAHHLIDPRTGAPSMSSVVAATVIAVDATSADVLAKVALLAGPSEGAAIVHALGAAGLLVEEPGHLLATPDLRRFT